MRTRDIDPILRRTVYHGSLSATALPDSRVLSIAQREDVVRNGLGDREGSVRKAAAGMLGGWVDQAEGDLLQVSTELLGRVLHNAEERGLTASSCLDSMLSVVRSQRMPCCRYLQRGQSYLIRSSSMVSAAIEAYQ